MKLPEILDEDHFGAAARLLSGYYSKTTAGLPAYTGSLFSCWGGGGDTPEVVNQVTTDDLVAVSFLALDVSGEAAFGILQTHAPLISDLLAQIPAGLGMASVPSSEFGNVFGEHSPALQLWHVLRGYDTAGSGLNGTHTSKLMARKRPHLIPIYDSSLAPLVGLEGPSGQWTAWHGALTDGTGLPHRLQEIRRISGISDPISELRVMDIVLWMHGKQLAAAGQEQEKVVSGAH